ncbi:MAG: ATP-binding protein [Endomicrobium sp.]|jgi:predicted AAA+ superfamily ATPase|nr:ATP-binding protein [Endomicrobium sp.]
MQRNAMNNLTLWKSKTDKMPLIIEGARQVGKTWLMQEFGRTQYQNTVYLNFEINIKARELFRNNIDPKYIISELELMTGSKINPEKTLIIFDEIQECNRALVSLKYFCEQAPNYDIISAGSLLGIAMHSSNSFPVGKVETLHLYPLTFSEFLDAIGESRYKIGLEKGDYSAFNIIENELITKLKLYYFIGGMPKAVLSYVQKHDLNEVRTIQENIIGNYEKDFSKHIKASSIPKVGMIWNNIPLQLAKEKKQWIYRNMREGARASQYEDALYWLEKVGLIYKISKLENIGLPLAGYQQDAFKLYMVDVGLLSAKTGLTIQNLADSNPEIFNHFKGALTEQYVLQELKALETKPQIFYWGNDRKKGIAEVDFVIQNEGNIIPIEAKASTNLRAKSLKVYTEYYKPKITIRTSLARYGQYEILYDVPLYLIGQLSNIIRTSLKKTMKV